MNHTHKVTQYKRFNIKLEVGRILNSLTDNAISFNYKTTPFIPTGRILPLDLKRAGIYPKMIFDVGANEAQSCNYFIKHFPDAEIYSFEPVSSTYNVLLSNISNSRIHPVNEGLGSVVQEQVINKHNSSGSSSLNTGDGAFAETEVVKINTGLNFCNERQIKDIDLLKIDVEGYELEVIKGFGAFLKNNVKMIYSEIGFEKGDPFKTYFPDLLDATHDSGFVMSGFYESFRWGNGKLRFYCNVLLTNTFLVDI